MAQEFSLDQTTRQWIEGEIANYLARPTTGRKHAPPRLAPPEFFDGISPDYEQWKSDVQVYVAGLDKDAAISAVLGLIRGTNVNRWKRNLVQAKFVANGNSWNYASVAAFWTELTAKFRPVNYVNDAIIALDQVHMGNQRAEDFFDQWEDLTDRAGEDKDTANNIYRLKNALPSGYLIAISTMPTKPANYADWKKTIIDMDNDRIIFN
uniref:Sensor histidine kinase RcsC (EC) n=1 Tax=Ganoderma boninense TaxID=34458 RepID=A0A5K1K1M7_9APHY|nr:Sensor histidine kinase RcsC (EC [Ganoderma boninense]